MENALEIKYDSQHKQLRIDIKDATPLPEDLFTHYPDARCIIIQGKMSTTLPASIGSLENLEDFRIFTTGISPLPDEVATLKKLKTLYFSGYGTDMNASLQKFGQLPFLTFLHIGGSAVPIRVESMSNFPQLAELYLKFEKVYPSVEYIGEVSEIVKVLPQLRKLDLDMDHILRPTVLTPAMMLIFDQLDTLSFFSSKWLRECWQCIAVTKHVKIYGWDNNLINNFRERTKDLPLTEEQLQILFAVDQQFLDGLNRFLPNRLASALSAGTKVSLLITQKVRSFYKGFLSYTADFTKDVHAKDVLAVIGSKTPFDEVLRLLMHKVPLITIDHITEVSQARESRYHPFDENEEWEILQLLLLNTAEGYQKAFDILVNTPAGRNVQSALAAIMRTHPDRYIRRTAQYFYSEYGTRAFFAHARKLGNALLDHPPFEKNRMQKMATHPDIDIVIFMLMSETIISKFYKPSTPGYSREPRIYTPSFKVQSALDFDIPPAARLFTQIQHWTITYSEINIDQICKGLARLPHVKSLTLKGVCDNLPESIGDIQSLESLTVHLNFKTEEEQQKAGRALIPSTLGKLTHLKKLYIDGYSYIHPDTLKPLLQLESLTLRNVGSDSWDALLLMNKMQELMLWCNNMKGIPDGIYNMTQLSHLSILDNDLSSSQERLGTLPRLKKVQLCHNRITSFPYSLSRNKLQSLDLKGNQITAIDADHLYAANNDQEISWEEFNISDNQLHHLQFKSGKIRIGKLFLNNNQLTSLDAAVFTASMVHFEADHNKMTEIPEAITIPTFVKITLNNNQLTTLPAFLINMKATHAYFNDNNITTIHPDVYRRASGACRVLNNPVTDEFPRMNASWLQNLSGKW